MQPDSWHLTSIVMAKLPQPGRVKTRLTATGWLDATQASAVASAMLRCIIGRLAIRGPVVLAVTPDDCEQEMSRHLPTVETPIRFTNQGQGGLGERMTSAWAAADRRTPIVFFGNDSPDVPEQYLQELAEASAVAEVVLGPTEDGGIWCLAAQRSFPELLDAIDWGTEHVYDQLLQRARQLGRRVAVLPQWVDIDHPEDIDAMLKRLDSASVRQSSRQMDSALLQLRSDLAQIGLTKPTNDSIR